MVDYDLIVEVIREAIESPDWVEGREFVPVTKAMIELSIWRPGSISPVTGNRILFEAYPDREEIWETIIDNTELEHIIDDQMQPDEITTAAGRPLTLMEVIERRFIAHMIKLGYELRENPHG